MALPLMMLTLDAFGLTVALPSIGRDLNANTATLAWVLNAFLLAFAAPQIAVGRTADIFGRRRMVLLGLVVFIAGSILAGLAPSIWVLIAARACQGVGSAMGFVPTLSIVNDSFPPDQRGQAIGLWAAAGTIGQSLGPLVAGVLTEKLTWRWFFFVNVPLGLSAILLALAFVPESRDETAPRSLDLRGFLVVTAGIVLLVLGIQTSSTLTWSSPLVWASLLAGLLLILLFLYIEPRTRNPLIQFNLFMRRAFLGSLVIHFSWNWVWGVYMFLLTLYLQHVRGLSPIQAGFVFLAFALPFIGSSAISGRVVRLLGGRITVFIGLTAALLGCLIFVTLATYGPLELVVLGSALFGVGGAFAYNAGTSLGMAVVPDAEAGGASGIQNTVLQLGAVFGVAVSTALFKAVENDRLLSLLNGVGAALGPNDQAEVRNLLSGSTAAQARLQTLAPAAANQIERIINAAFMDGFHAAMALCFAIAFVGLCAALLMPGRPARAPAGKTD
jgi:EmrB/QacA subfamily drug resistance transporter